MRVWLLWLLLIAPPLAGQAQEPVEPIVRTELEKSEAIPGQPIALRVTVLVPTWLPEPPAFPSFELPNVAVRLPERASGPTSDRVGAETWSGVTRAYRLYPLVAGEFQLPPRTIIVTYADPNTSKPVQARLTTEAVAFAGVVPKEAHTLDPFIAADRLTLEQEITGDVSAMTAGGAVTRKITADVSGVSPFAIPALLDTATAEGIAAYPKEPTVSEKENRGELSGRRIESVTYIAEKAGRYTSPAIELRWYNLKTKEIETAKLDAIDFAIAGTATDAGTSSEKERNLLIPITLLILSVPALIAMFLKEQVRHVWNSARSAYRQSEFNLYRDVRGALRVHNLGKFRTAFDIWTDKLAAANGPAERELHETVLKIGAAKYAAQEGRPSSQLWLKALNDLHKVRRERLHHAEQSTRQELKPLNPTGRHP